jgi:hypothetical protein
MVLPNVLGAARYATFYDSKLTSPTFMTQAHSSPTVDRHLVLEEANQDRRGLRWQTYYWHQHERRKSDYDLGG